MASPRWLSAEVADATKKAGSLVQKLQKHFFPYLVRSSPTEADHQTFTMGTGMTMGHKSPLKKAASENGFLYFLVSPFIPLLLPRSEISKLFY